MDLGQLCQDVFTLTDREDLVAETQLAVRRAAHKFHMLDSWKRDRAENVFLFSATSATAALALNTFERWRRFETLVPYDSVNNVILPCVDDTDHARGLKEISPDSLFDRFLANKTDVYYVSGSQVNMRFANGQGAIFASWYKYPQTDVANFNSWIADIYPYLIIEEAAGHILTITGSVEEGNKYIDPIKGSVYEPMHGLLQSLRANEL